MEGSKLKVIIPRIALIIGVLIIPLMYSYFYLNAFWDPYERLDDVPVAVVNEDTGAEINGEQRNLGDEIVEKLKEEHTVDFKFTSAGNAKRGVLGDAYYASITIPEDFSSRAATVGEDTEKLHGTIVYEANQKKNYLAAQILENAMPTIKESVNSKIDAQITGKLAGKLREVPKQLGKLDDGLYQLDNGAAKLKDGTAKLSQGAGTLSNGLDTLNGKVPVLKKGTADLNAGAIKLSGGMKKINGNNSILNKGMAQLNGGLGTLKKGVKKYTNGVKQAGAGSKTLKNGVKAYTDGVDAAKTGAGTLKEGIGAYTNGVNQLNTGAGTLTSGLKTAGKGVDDMAAKVDAAKKKLDTEASDEKLNEIKGGAKQLNDGLAGLNNQFNVNGIMQLVEAYKTTGKETYKTQLQTALQTADSTITALHNGSTVLKGGVDLLAGGMSEVRSNLGTLQGGLAQLQAAFGGEGKEGTLIGGAAQISGGLTQLDGNSAALNKGAGDLSSGLGIIGGNSEKLNKGASDLNKGLKKLNKNNKKLNKGTSDAKKGSKKLKSGVKKYTKGVGTAGKGAKQLAGGTKKLNGKVPALASGINKLDEGGRQLADGAGTLDSGAGTLSSGIKTASRGVSKSVADANSDIGKLDGLEEYSKEPVKTKTEYVQPVANYGSAFAPYFMGLSLWVGGLLIFFGIYFDYNRRIKMLTMDSIHFLQRSFLFAVISGGQGVLLAFVIKSVLNITVNHPWALYGACILAAFAFTAVIQFCIINLGDIGKFLAMLLLILQLTSCAGTFPLETQNEFFKAINPFLPMTYSTQLFKEVISGTLGSNAMYSALILLAYAVGFLTLTNVLSRNLIKKDMESIAKIRSQHA